MQTAIVIAIVLCAIGFMIRHMHKSIRSGSCDCGCGCGKKCPTKAKELN